MHQHFVKFGTPPIKLIEECSEVIQALCKAERFGLDNYHPETKITNRDAVKNEISDLLLAIKNYQAWENTVPLGTDMKREKT